jgi:adenine-specific DNA-methyltransferase
MKRLSSDSPELKSADLVAENIERLRELFPEAFANEGNIDFDVLRQLLGDRVDDGEERYGLNWHGKRAARQLALTPSTGTLRPCPEESVDWDTTQNIFIEGDNLEVLKLLQKSYAGKVKLIYIDPPYNTGNEFIYSDRFSDPLQSYLSYTQQVDTSGNFISTNTEASGRFHTAWLSMMLPRLRLARTLLRHDGVIFVSIDDHELDNLRKVMDEVFGSEHFVSTIIWQKVYAPKNTARHFSQDHDYIVVYAKDAESWRPNLLPRTEEQDSHYSNPDNDPRGPWRTDGMSARNYYSKGTYAIITPGGRRIEGPPSGRYWVYSEEKFKELNADNRIWWGADGNNQPAVKRFLSEVSGGRVPQTLWQYSDVGHTQEAKKELLQRVAFDSSDDVFDTPKPTRLIRQILRLATQPETEDVVLDFFAGSGSTAEAVMAANRDDGGNRRYLLVQLPERTASEKFPTIADITKARIEAACRAEKLASASTECGFRVFKLDSGNVQTWAANRETLTESLSAAVDHVKADRTEDDLLYEIILKHGLDLCAVSEEKQIGGHNVRSIGDGAVFACFGSRITAADVEPLAHGIAKWRDDLAPANPELSRVIFRDSAFDTDVAKTNLAAILKQRGFDERLIVSL